MNVRVRMKVGAADFFDAVAASALEDVLRRTGRPVSREEMKAGFRYASAGEEPAEVEILDYREGRAYAARITRKRYAVEMSYRVEEDRGDSIRVLMEQKLVPERGESTIRVLGTKVIMAVTLKRLEREIRARKGRGEG